MVERKHSSSEEPGSSAGAEEKARQAHAVISRLLALAGAPPFPGLMTATAPQPQQQYRFSYYYPTVGWPSSAVPAASWTWPPAAAGASAAGSPLAAPFLFPGSFR